MTTIVVKKTEKIRFSDLNVGDFYVDPDGIVCRKVNGKTEENSFPIFDQNDPGIVYDGYYDEPLDNIITRIVKVEFTI